jgi:hypothetical protein
MKQMILIVWVAVSATLACLSTVVIDAAQPIADIEVATRFEEVEALTVMPSPLPSPMGRGDRVCAVVVADEALHLRSAAHADGDIILHLRRGELVLVVIDSDPNWWRVSFEGFEGFARSMYLQFSDCEVSDE